MLKEDKSRFAGKTKLTLNIRLRLTIALMLGLMTFAFVFLHPGTAEKNVLPPAPQSNDFLIGGLHNAADVNFTYVTNPLNFNLWHSYLGSETDPVNGKKYPFGWLGNGAADDKLFAAGNEYIGQVQGVINEIASHNMKVLLHRPKIEYLSYGQRSDYQCEPKSTSHSKWFYSFNDNQTGALFTEPNGDSSIFCTPGNTTNSGSWVHNPGFVCKRLKANTEQSHSEAGDDAYRWDSQNDWYIKPRIRIDSVWAANNPNVSVCKIIALNENLDTIKNLTIKASNFSDLITPYNGDYIEEFFFDPNDSNLIIPGAHWGDKWWFTARGTRDLSKENEDFNHADIQVYWYGNCDMWIDYVRVDNDIADGLFNPNNSNFTIFQNWLEWEAKDIACYSSGAATINFYVELVEFNNLPCIKRVNERLNYYKNCDKQLSVMADLLCFPLQSGPQT